MLLSFFPQRARAGRQQQQQREKQIWMEADYIYDSENELIRQIALSNQFLCIQIHICAKNKNAMTEYPQWHAVCECMYSQIIDNNDNNNNIAITVMIAYPIYIKISRIAISLDSHNLNFNKCAKYICTYIRYTAIGNSTLCPSRSMWKLVHDVYIYH